MPKDIEELLRRAAEKDADDRAHYHALRDQLEARMRQERVARRRLAIVVSIAALALLLLGLLAWRTFDRHGLRTPAATAADSASACARPASRPLPPA